MEGWKGGVHPMVSVSGGLTYLITSAEEFVRLRTSQDPAEYRRAAIEDAPPTVWQEVLDRFPEYRRWVAHNKTVPIEILQILAKDPDPQVRWFVAAKNRLTPDLLEKLAHDSDESVRRRVVRHKRLPIELLESLRSDPSEGIRLIATERLSRLERE